MHTVKVFEYHTRWVSTQLGLIASLSDIARLLKSCARRRLSAQRRVGSGACSRTAETDRRGRLKWFDVTGRPPTWHVDLAANTGVTPLNRPENIDLSVLLHLPVSSLFSSSSTISLFPLFPLLSALSHTHTHSHTPALPLPLSLHAVS